MMGRGQVVEGKIFGDGRWPVHTTTEKTWQLPRRRLSQAK
jgi:hypothetical protein